MFILSKFAIALISPLGTSLFLGLCALLFAAASRKRVAAVLGTLAVVWLGVWSLPVPSNWLRGTLEDQFPRVAVQALPSADAIVVLGGGVRPPATIKATPNLEAGADRVWYGARLFEAGKAPLVLLSGGSDPAFSTMSEAQAMRELMVAFGVNPGAIVLEGQSRNTTQNARLSAQMLRERGAHRILLVTSALHMARALARFKHEGLIVVPAATDYEVRQGPAWADWLPDTLALDGSARAMKEWVGLWVGR